MKKVKVKASARSAAELLAAQGGGGFGSGFGGAFGSGFGSAFGSAFAQPAEADLPAAAAASSSSTAASASDGADAWSQLMAARSRDVQEVHDPALVLAFKSLSKRDATTRLKSLASVVEQFGTMDAAAATAVLPAWLQVYERVQLDNDRRVREALYKAFGQLLSRVPGRALQPHLRTTFPLWWLHMQDPCREVAKESRALFNSTFPTAAKRAQVLVYCHSAFFAYCTSLFQQTPQTLSDQSIYSLEESTDKWERIIACALAGIAEFVEVLSAQAAEAVATASAAAPAPLSVTLDAYSKLLTPTVWKLSKCRTVHIRRALYALLKSLVTHDPAGVVEASMGALAPLLLVDLLDEADRSNHPAMLDALLTFLRSFGAQAWAQLSKPTSAAGGTNLVQSAFYPRLNKLLLTGLYGNWTGFYPCLLPLLSLLPDSIMEQAPVTSGKAAGDSPLAVFYAFFFGSLFEGRRALRDAATGSLLSGSKELHALLDAYGECLLYSVKKRRTDADPALVHALVHTHFVSTLLSPPVHFASSSASDPSVSAEVRSLNSFGPSYFERVGRVLRELAAALSSDPQGRERVDQLWQEVGRVCSDAVVAAANAPALSAEENAPASPVAADAATAAPSPVHKRLAATVAVQSIDSFLAVGIVLVQAAAKGPAAAAASAAESKDGSVVSPAQLRCAASVFERSLAHFVSRPSSARLSSLKLCAQLVDAHSLGAILSSYPSSPPPSLAAFLSASLLPVLRQLLSAAGQATDSVSDAASAAHYSAYMETVELFSRGLLARALDELSQAQAGAVAPGVWGELLHLLSASSPLSSSSSLLASKSHLSLLRILFEQILCRAPSVRGHPALQDLVVDLAERMLTCERGELLSELQATFSAILAAQARGHALLQAEVLFTLLSSFLEGVLSFQKQEGDLSLLSCSPGQASSSLSLGFVQRFEKETGCSVHAVPALVKLLGTLLAAGEKPLLDALAPTPAEAESTRAQLVHSLFWLQFSARAGVARAASEAWKRVDRSLLQQHPGLLLDLAGVFRQRLLSLPLSSFTSHFIVSWSAWLVQLYSSVSDPAIQHALLDAALPSHEEIKRMMGGLSASASASADCDKPSLHDVAERLRVIRDLVSELLSSAHADTINERVLFLGDASPSGSGSVASPKSWQAVPRLGLLLDLLAVQRFLRCFEREADAAAMPSDEDAGVAVAFPAASPAESEEAALHPSIQHRLQGYVSSSFLSPAHFLTLVKTALEESSSPLKDAATASAATVQAATDCARSYTSALGWLLSLAQDSFFDAEDEEDQDAEVHAARAAVHSALVAFLSGVPMASLRPQDHSAVFTPLESTLVVVLESGCLCARGGSSATDALLVQLMRGVLAGLEAGMRTLSKQNARLFALSSSLNLLAALLRAAYAAINADGGTSDELQSVYASTRTKLVALAPNFNLFDPLVSGAGGFGAEVCRFMEARSTLVHALIECAEGELDEDEADAAAALESAVTPALLQSAVLWSASVLRFATNQHAAAIRRSRELLLQKGRSSASASSSAVSAAASSPTPPSDVAAAWSFAYLPATLALMAHLMPLVLSSSSAPSSSTLASALHVFMGAGYPLMVGGGGGAHANLLLSVLSVKCFTRLSVDLEQLFRCYREQRTERLMELVREGMRDRSSAAGEGDSDSAELRSLFLLLSHPFPCVALAALHCLSVGLRERAIATEVSFETDEAEEMRHVLAASAKQSAKALRRRARDAQSSPDSGDAGGDGSAAAGEDAEDVALEHYRKTLRSSYRSAQTQKRVDQILPQTLQRILEERLRVNEVDVLEEEGEEEAEAGREEMPFFSFRPVALQLRAHLLTWSLVLDLLSQPLPAPAAAGSSSSSAGATPVQVSLSSEKSALLVSYLRDGDCAAPFASELVEHVLVGLTESQTEELILGAVARYEHRVKSAEGEGEDAASSSPAPASAPEVPAPAVEIEDEDEEGNVRPAAAPKPASAAASAAEEVADASDSSVAIREFPLWLSPCMLLPSEARQDVKVLPFLMKRLLKIRKSEQHDGGATGGAVVDPCIFYGHMSALLYLRTLRVLPALSRSWFSHMDRSNGAVVSKMTAASFSALLIQDELLDVNQRQAAEMRAHPHHDEEEQFVITTNYEPAQWRAGSGSAGRRAAAAASAPPAVVSAKFTRGEISMGLSLKLPPCYPLLPVSASLTDAVKLKEERSKKWLLSITSILGSSDGSVYSAVQAWHANLLQHFAGVEECTICYSVVSATNHALPRMKCNECSNRFHSSCLYKWFQSSGNSRCPLCRTLFSA